jgi:1,4-alpha-glucan branching enzyme
MSSLAAPTRAGRVGQLAVLGATAALFLVVGTFLTQNRPFAPATEPSLASRANHEILFVVPALDAENVAVVGDFNAWEATPLSDDNEDGIWTAAIPLPPGRYEYAFVIDGRWWGQDPLADEYVKTFGQYSSVRYVGEGGDGV